MADFFAFVKKEAPELIFNEKEYLISKKMLQMRIRANIAQDLWTSSESYQIFNDYNEALQKALEVYKLKKYNSFNLDQ
jgi:carboxyl-terminal processing protease